MGKIAQNVFLQNWTNYHAIWNGTDLYREDILWFVFANTCSQLLARTIKSFILASGFKDDNEIHKCHSNPV